MKDKKNIIILGITTLVLMIISIAILLFFILAKNEKIELENPIINLTEEEALEKFNEDFVVYLLYKIGANNLKTNPLNKDKPRIILITEEATYSAEISKAKILVRKSEINSPDIKIRTTKKEIIKMMQDEGHIKKSFESGASKLEIVADRNQLLLKGYLNIYENFA